MPKMRTSTAILDKLELMPQGFERRSAYLTRTGVLKYRMKDGSVLRQLRHPEDVFDADSIATLAGVPITNEHPSDLLDSSTAKEHVVGWLGDKVEIEDIYLKSVATIIDDKTLADIRAGKVEISCGYNADFEEEPGVYNGEPYDVRQKNIVYNHVSIVKRGRAGEKVRFLDSADAEELNEESLQMIKVMIGGKEYEVAPDLAEAIKGLQAQHTEMDALKVKAEDAEKKVGEVETKLSAETAHKDSLADELKALKVRMDSNTDEKFQSAVKARVTLEKTAASISDKINIVDSSDLDIKKEIVKAKFPTVNFDGKDETYVNARFDHALEVIADDEKSKAALREKFVPRGVNRDGEETLSPAEARKKAMADSQTAWQTK